ncbi:hypothetical protein EC9_38960 [Rosistilla ulvae]|uniref:Uncharacterized protein n=1 Tax=Rosistilla ulvae TaxID=1930277 RepID=A0A517M4A7_9BACT|nr:hypothetical protein EC9_38960 [Rosistilla ulvae]
MAKEGRRQKDTHVPFVLSNSGGCLGFLLEGCGVGACRSWEGRFWWGVALLFVWSGLVGGWDLWGPCLAVAL